MILFATPIFTARKPRIICLNVVVSSQNEWLEKIECFMRTHAKIETYQKEKLASYQCSMRMYFSDNLVVDELKRVLAFTPKIT